jgi:hypothetical protein
MQTILLGSTGATRRTEASGQARGNCDQSAHGAPEISRTWSASRTPYKGVAEEDKTKRQNFMQGQLA